VSALNGEKQAVRDKESSDAPEWVLEVPQPIRDSGILDFFKVLGSGLAKNEELSVQKKVGERSFYYKFRAKRDESHIFEANPRDWNRKTSKIARFLRSFRTRKKSFLIRFRMQRVCK